MNRLFITLFALTTTNTVFAQASADRIIARMKSEDINKDGKLTRAEFKGSNSMFQRLDDDGDGILILKDVLEQLTPKSTSNNRVTKRDRSPVQPDYADIQYGEHERHVLDVYMAKNNTNGPVPLMIWIHGGGFRSGDKSQGAHFAKYFTNEGICFITLNYRLSGHAIAPACFHDCARALQFIRYNATKWNIDKNHIAVGGGSAGAGLAQWLAYSPERADSKANDPVLHESSRANALVLSNAQTSYDPRWIKKHIPGEAWQGEAIQELYDINIEDLDQLPEEKYALMKYCSPITHFTTNAPPAIFFYRRSKDPKIAEENAMDGIHHPLFGFELKKLADKYSVECEVFTVEDAKDRNFYNNRWDYSVSFLKRHFETD